MKRTGWLNEHPEVTRLLNDILFVDCEFDTSQYDYQVQLLKSASLNACAFANGRIYLHAAIFCLVEDEAELATILGHELQHVQCNHSVKKAQQRLTHRKEKVLRELTFNLSDLKQAIRKGELTYSREHENEADSLGLLWLMNRDYDPHATLDLWTRMNHYSIALEGEAYELYASHENTEKRIENLEQIIGEYDSGKRWIYTDSLTLRRLQGDLIDDVIWTYTGSLDPTRELDEIQTAFVDFLLSRYTQVIPEPNHVRLAELRIQQVKAAGDSTVFQGIITELMKARQEQPQYYPYAFLQADIYENQKQYAEASAVYQELFDDPDYTGRKGVLRIRIDRLKKAIEEEDRQ